MRKGGRSGVRREEGRDGGRKGGSEERAVMIPVPVGGQGGVAGGEGWQREGLSLTSDVYLAWPALPGGCSWAGWYRHTPVAGITVLVNWTLHSHSTHKHTVTHHTHHTQSHITHSHKIHNHAPNGDVHVH